MSNIHDSTIKAFQRYINMLTDKGIKSADLSSETILYKDLPKMLPHAKWMCETALSKMKTNSFSDDKASRWLGFVQAILIFNGLTSIEVERNITRPWFN